MKNVLIISTSLRGGSNSELLAKECAKGAEEAGNRVELLSLKGKKIQYCIGCLACIKTGKCVQKDDAPEIMEKLRQADVLVIASPVYFYGLSAQLKAVIDRLHTPMRNTFPIRKLALLLVGGAELPELFDSILVQYRLALNFFHLEDAGQVLVRGVRDRNDIQGNPALDEARALGRSMR